METYTQKISIEFTYTSQDIDDIMSTALEGGICYWCDAAIPVDGYLGEYASDQISRGGSLELRDAESDDKWILTPGKFAKGLRLWMEQVDGGASLDGCELDACNIDACDADCIVQYALFDEIVFG